MLSKSNIENKDIIDKFNCNKCHESYFRYELVMTIDNCMYCLNCNFERANERYLNTFSY